MAKRMTPEQIEALPKEVSDHSRRAYIPKETIDAMKKHARFVKKEMAAGRLICKG